MELLLQWQFPMAGCFDGWTDGWMDGCLEWPEQNTSQ